MGMKVDSIQLGAFYLDVQSLNFSPETMHLSPFASARAAMLSRESSEKVHFSRLALQARQHDQARRVAERHAKLPHRTNPAHDPRVQPGKTANPNLPLFVQLLKMEEEAQETYFKEQAHSPNPPKTSPGEEHRKMDLTRWEGQEYARTALFTPAQSQALCRGFITLCFKWLGEEEAKAVVPQVFPLRREKDRAQYLSALYNDKLPVRAEYAELVALNIVGLLRRQNPGQDVSPTIDFVMQIGNKPTVAHPDHYKADPGNVA